MDKLLVDSSERLDGPSLIVLRGDDQPDCEFRLGTREYDWHHHKRGQIFCIKTGLMHIRTKHASWILPPQRAGWVPPGVEHQIKLSGATSGWCILIVPAICSNMSSLPCAIAISDLMDSLIKRIVSWNVKNILEPYQERVVGVLLDEVERSPCERLNIPLPTDLRLLRITDEIIKHHDDRRTLEEWATWAGISPRTLRRLFLSDTGLTFSQWRQQANLMQALEMLVRGDSVSVVADALGYATPSGFIEMFRRAFGESPARYVSRRCARDLSPVRYPS